MKVSVPKVKGLLYQGLPLAACPASPPNQRTGEGNGFSRVCMFVHGEGGTCPHAPQRHIQSCSTWTSLYHHPTCRTCSDLVYYVVRTIVKRAVCIRWNAFLLPPSMHHWSHDQGSASWGGLPPRGQGRTPSPRDMVDLRAVRVLLESILV